MQLEQRRALVAERVQQVVHPRQPVVDVAQVGPHLGRDGAELVARERQHGVALRPDDAGAAPTCRA